MNATSSGPIAPPTTSPPRWVIAVAVILVLSLHWIGVDRFPNISSDEGGWPLAVRQWLDGGGGSRDFVMAPGYHWLLGGPMWLFGPYHWVTRPVSIVVSLIGLGLFYRLSHRLADAKVAFWATLLLGTSYSAVMVDRRAYIEPFQITLMFALCLCALNALNSHRRLGWEAGVTMVTALLLLTKASAVFLLPALALAALWPPLQLSRWRPLVRLSFALAIGSSIAALVFWQLQRQYPVAFAIGWGTDMRISELKDASPWFRIGRFGLDPRAIEATLGWFGLQEPLMLGLAFAALCMAVVKREQLLMTLWLVFGAVFQSIQFYVQDNHRVVIVAPICFLTAWLLCDVERRSEQPPHTRGPLTWTSLLLTVMVAFGSTRVLLAMVSVRNTEKPAVAWLSEHTGARDTVVAAAYVLMQIKAHPVPYVTSFPPPFHIPTIDRLADIGANWIVVDEREWKRKTLESIAARRQFDEALTACCNLTWSSPQSPLEVYHVRPRP